MYTTQKVYAEAKAAYELVAQEKARLLAPYGHLIDGDGEDYEVYAAFEEQFNTDLRCDEFRATLRTAERAMIDWANAKVSSNKRFSTKHKEAMDFIMANIHRPELHRKMVDLAFRLG